MLRLGIISELGTGEYLGYARVYFDEVDMVSAWLPLPSAGTRTAKHWQPVEVNSQVACLMDEECEQGCVVASLWSDTDTPPDWANENTIGIQFADGAQVYYDSDQHKMVVIAPDTDAEVTCKNVTMTCEVLKVTGKVDISGDVEIDGKGHITGQFTSDTEVTAKNINLTTHKHPTPTGVSGPPTP